MLERFHLTIFFSRVEPNGLAIKIRTYLDPFQLAYYFFIFAVRSCIHYSSGISTRTWKSV